MDWRRRRWWRPRRGCGGLIGDCHRISARSCYVRRTSLHVRFISLLFGRHCSESPGYWQESSMTSVMYVAVPRARAHDESPRSGRDVYRGPPPFECEARHAESQRSRSARRSRSFLADGLAPVQRRRRRGLDAVMIAHPDSPASGETSVTFVPRKSTSCNAVRKRNGATSATGVSPRSRKRS